MISKLKKSRTRQITLISIFVSTGCITLLFAIFKIWFKSEIVEISDYAMNYYEGDKVESLIHLALDENQELQLRNNAIWALGKTRDSRSIPALKTLQTGEPCVHNTQVCQEELEKAILTREGKELDLFTYR